MPAPREGSRSGLEAVHTMTALMQRVHLADPAFGLYQAAELEWWWSSARPTDTLDQLFWFDDDDRPVAAATLTDFGDGSSLVYGETTLVVAVMPGAPSEWIEHVVGRGLAHAERAGIGAVSIEVDRTDDAMRDLLVGRHGFRRADDGLIECWLDAAARPPISPLAEGYRLAARSELTDRPHHMAGTRRPAVAQRLAETSLYRRELDLVVLAPDDEPAAYAVFWYDPVTATGVVEPMRTHDEHQRRGLGRHVLTAGVDRLARAGATRISIGFEPDNPASGPLYLSVGFVPHLRTDVYTRP